MKWSSPTSWTKKNPKISRSLPRALTFLENPAITIALSKVMNGTNTTKFIMTVKTHLLKLFKDTNSTYSTQTFSTKVRPPNSTLSLD